MSNLKQVQEIVKDSVNSVLQNSISRSHRSAGAVLESNYRSLHLPSKMLIFINENFKLQCYIKTLKLIKFKESNENKEILNQENKIQNSAKISSIKDKYSMDEKNKI